jgi:hypothetical protein
MHYTGATWSAPDPNPKLCPGHQVMNNQHQTITGTFDKTSGMFYGLEP